MLLINSNCNTKKIEVFDKSTSILYDFAVIEIPKFHYKKVLNNSTSNPLLFNYLNPTLNTKVDFDIKEGWFNVDYYLFKAFDASTVTVLNKNVLQYCGIYNAFIGYNYVLIDENYYEIDKSKSSDCELFLKSPITNGTIINKTVGKGNKETEIGYSICESTRTILKEVIDLKCVDCSKEFEKHYKELTLIQLLKSNCIKDEEIKHIVDSITDKYGTKSC